MALTKVIGAGLGTLTEDQVLGGATPTLTIGDAGAEDTKIVFDGNAQDYHIGLDDSADTLVIGKGSALGTTTAMSIDAAGIITKPLQPAFMAVSQTMTNIASGTTLTFGTEIFDQNADFSSNTFTAPVTGRYQLNFSGYILNMDTDANYYQVTVSTSNRDYNWLIDPNWASDVLYWAANVNVLADMDASDTALIRFYTSGGTQQADLDAGSFFSGYLVA